MQETSTSHFTAQRNSRGYSAPARTAAHYQRIMELLIERKANGEEYVLSSYLYDHPELYGRSPRNRISEARKHHDIQGEAYGDSDWRYWLVELDTPWKRPTARPTPAPKPEPAKAEGAWADRKPVTGLPLWDSAVASE